MTADASEGQPRSTPTAAAKQALRHRLRAARFARPEGVADAAARTQAALDACRGADVVAAYVARAEEPQTQAVLDALWRAGTRVLLPVLRLEPDWAWYAGPESLRPGPRGIGQPGSAGLGAEALRLADVVLLPGLAGTLSGDRLGSGGGWYDRALAWARPDTRLGLLLFAEEVLPEVPTDDWDRPVDFLVTEAGPLDCVRR